MSLIDRLRRRTTSKHYEPRYWMYGALVDQATFDAEIEAMQKPPRNAWGGARTEQEWLDLQHLFAEQQRRYEARPHAHGSNSWGGR